MLDRIIGMISLLRGTSSLRPCGGCSAVRNGFADIGVRVAAPFGATLCVTILLSAVPALAARLGGAYYVDDAEIGKSGSCEIETWSSFARTGDRIAVFSPACVVDVGRPVEIGTNLVDLRSDGQEDVLATLTAKTVPIPIGRSGGFGLAIAAAIVYDPLNQTG